jgi:serine/threonine protein kinase
MTLIFALSMHASMAASLQSRTEVESNGKLVSAPYHDIGSDSMVIPDEDSMVVPDEDFKSATEVRAASEDLAATRIFGETWRGQNGSLLEAVVVGGEEFRPQAWLTKLAKDKVKLGAGAFGTVFGVKARCDPSSQFAVKIQRAQGKQQAHIKSFLKEVGEEVKMMEALNTDRFVKILSHTEGPTLKDKFTRYSILMEKASGAFDKFTQPGGYRGNFVQAATFFVELLEGLAYMHEKNFVHRDLKPANVLISCADQVMKDLKAKGFSTTKDVCHAKIADLGLTCTYKGTCSGVAGTPLYMPPELLGSRVIHYSNDVWAMGLIFYELVLKTLPAKLKQSRTMDDLKRNIMSLKAVMPAGDIAKALGISEAEAGKVKDLIEGMLKPDPASRLSAKAALKLANALTVDVAVPAGVSVKLPACWDQKEKEPEPEPEPAPAAAPEDLDEDSMDLGNIKSDSDEDFLVVKAKRAGGDVGVNFIVNWLVGDLEYARMIKGGGKYVQSVLPKWFTEARYDPVEVNSIPIAEIRKNKDQYSELMKNGLMGEAIVIKVVKK